MTTSQWALGLALVSLALFATAAVLIAVESGPLHARAAFIVAATATGIALLLQLVDRHQWQRDSSGEDRL